MPDPLRTTTGQNQRTLKPEGPDKANHHDSCNDDADDCSGVSATAVTTIHRLAICAVRLRVEGVLVEPLLAIALLAIALLTEALLAVVLLAVILLTIAWLAVVLLAVTLLTIAWLAVILLTVALLAVLLSLISGTVRILTWVLSRIERGATITEVVRHVKSLEKRPNHLLGQRLIHRIDRCSALGIFRSQVGKNLLVAPPRPLHWDS